jgi:hypothetical protein
MTWVQGNPAEHIQRDHAERALRLLRALGRVRAALLRPPPPRARLPRLSRARVRPQRVHQVARNQVRIQIRKSH